MVLAKKSLMQNMKGYATSRKQCQKVFEFIQYIDKYKNSK